AANSGGRGGRGGGGAEGAGRGAVPAASPRRPRRTGLPRRALVAATVVGAGGSALAQRPPQPPRAKGPLVWLDMDQQDLDDAYDQLVYAPNRDYILKRCARNSELARERLGVPKRFAYGAT